MFIWLSCLSGFFKEYSCLVLEIEPRSCTHFSSTLPLRQYWYAVLSWLSAWLNWEVRCEISEAQLWEYVSESEGVWGANQWKGKKIHPEFGWPWPSGRGLRWNNRGGERNALILPAFWPPWLKPLCVLHSLPLRMLRNHEPNSPPPPYSHARSLFLWGIWSVLERSDHFSVALLASSLQSVHLPSQCWDGGSGHHSPLATFESGTMHSCPCIFLYYI